MASLMGLLHMGSRGLMANQTAINIIGNNIANVNTPGYSRQRVILTESFPQTGFSPGMLPSGVAVTSIQRVRDQFLDTQIRIRSSDVGYFEALRKGYQTIETMMRGELGSIDMDLGETTASFENTMQAFFNSFQQLSNYPESVPIRAAVRQTAITLTDSFRDMSTHLNQYRRDIDTEISATVDLANNYLQHIADLNSMIVKEEADGTTNANAFRDERDLILTQLSELLPITYHEEPNKSLTVHFRGSTLVDNTRANLFVKVREPDTALGWIEIYTQNEQSRALTQDFNNGKLGGLIEARDTVVVDFLDRIDDLAYNLIKSVNDFHTKCTGLLDFTTVRSDHALPNDIQPIGAFTLDFPVTNGEFTIRVSDADGFVQHRHRITIDPTTDSLADIAARISSMQGLSATSTQGRLEISADSGLSFGFENDTTGLLSMMQINTFFQGTDAGSIALSNMIADTEQGLERIAVSKNGAPGDGDGAIEIASLAHRKVARNNSTSLPDIFRSIMADLGTQGQRVSLQEHQADRIRREIIERQESIAGVSIDEESVSLVQFQHAYSANARYVTVIDSMLEMVILRMGVG